MSAYSRSIPCAFVALLWFSMAASAETVEVAPGVNVTKKTYSAPANEQPFFGFIEKTEPLRALDQTFIDSMIQAAGTRSQAFEEAIKRAWIAINTGKIPEAAKRFNQAYLLAPERSGVYHGFAIIAQARFNDTDFAEELFRIASKQPAPLKMLNADHGRLLLIAKRPADAQPILEQAIIDVPDFGDSWSNLAMARLQNGDRAGACSAADEAIKRRPSSNASRDLTLMRRTASCP